MAAARCVISCFTSSQALMAASPDPMVIARWSGWAAILILPVLLLLWQRPRNIAAQYIQAATLALWTISLNS